MAIKFEEVTNKIDPKYVIGNAGAYVFNSTNKPSAPSINADPRTVTSEGLSEAIGKYDKEVAVYKSDFGAFIGMRDYLLKRLQHDLAASTGYLAKNGVDLQTNKIVLHKKANDVFSLALSGKSIGDRGSVASIADEYLRINDMVCLNDEKAASALTESYEVEAKYDDRAFVLNSTAHNPVKIFPTDHSTSSPATTVNFILDNPNAATENDRIYTAYSNEKLSPEPVGADIRYVNTAKYTLGFEKQIVVKHVPSEKEDPNLTEKTISSVWIIRDLSNPVSESTVGTPVAYIQGKLNASFDSTLPENPWVKYEAPAKKK